MDTLKSKVSKKQRKLFITVGAWGLLAVVILALVLTKPPMKTLSEQVPGDFIAQAMETKKGFADYDFPLGILNLHRAKNLQTADTYTLIGIAGQVIPMNGKLSDTVASVLSYIPALGAGAWNTLLLTILSTSAGLFGGIFFALGKMSKFKPLSWLCDAYIFFFRGTPLLMQLFFIYYGLPLINPNLGISNKFAAAFFALMLNSFAYCAEIVRAAIQSIDKGQFEAAKSLGLTYGQTMRLIVIPQSVRRALPPVANEFIMVIKDCAIVSMIALPDLMKVTSATMNSTASVLVFFPSAVMYLIMTAFFTYVFNKLEKRFSVYQ